MTTSIAKIDPIEIFRFDPPRVKPGMCLSGVYDVLTSDFLFHVKNPKGFPVDPRRISPDGIFDQQTEGNPPAGWKDPSCIKLHVGNGGRGNKICSRFITTFPHIVYGYQSPYWILVDDKWDYVNMSVGATKYVLNEARFVQDWGGDVGKTPAYILNYFYAGKPDLKGKDLVQVCDPNTGTFSLVPGRYNSLENYYYPKPFGLVWWNDNALQPDGTYKQTNKSSISNQILPQSNWKDPNGKPYPTNYVNIPFMVSTV